MKKHGNLIIALIVVAGAGLFGWKYWQSYKAAALPAGIAPGNGRLEARLTYVSTKEALRVKENRVMEGDLVKPGQLVVTMDTVTLEAQLSDSGPPGRRCRSEPPRRPAARPP